MARNNPDQYGYPLWAKLLITALVIGAGATLGLLLHNWASSVGNDESDAAPTAAAGPSAAERQKMKVERLEKELAMEAQGARADAESATPPASAGSNGTTAPPSNRSGNELAPGAEASFEQLVASLGGEAGISVAPFGSSPPTTFGNLPSGHAWSSLKVPIVVAVAKSGGLSSEQLSLASSAITASDNAAAASLFSSLGSTTTASQAVESVLAESGYGAEVATGPPPSGAVSTWGQTDWSLDASTAFYRALACDQLLPEEQTEQVLSLMENVIPEQRWGLPEAGIEADVAVKAGWGPEGSSSGPYLVRQAGILRSSESTGVVVTIAAKAASGSFDGGVQDLNALAGWVKDNVRVDSGSC